MGLREFFGVEKPTAEVEPNALDGMNLSEQKTIDEKAIAEAMTILQKYKNDKSNLETRVVEDELWWEGRHWEAIGNNDNESKPLSTSAWLFNSVMNKHADAMDNYPICTVLPRERSDETSAKTLTEVLPVIFEQNNFEQTYSDNWWEKLKHGTGIYGVFWNSQKNNGLGDIDIQMIDITNVFWESGVTDIQKSRNLFITQLVDKDILKEQYPDLEDKLDGNAVEVKQYQYDDNVDTTDKTVVVDWYYKTNVGGKQIVHYCKFVAGAVLYASENDPQYRNVGYYNHGMYPIVMDVLFPEKGTPCGFGFVALNKNPQIYIDYLSANILESSMMGTKKRFFASSDLGINKDDFLDWSNPIVEFEGHLDASKLQSIEVTPLAPVYMNVLQYKVEEMKDTSGNRDVNSGGAGGGITAASAISALQEAGNKGSRDMISTSYRAYTEIARLCVELIRQFYDESRAFRITGDNNEYRYASLDNSQIKPQLIGIDSEGYDMFREPIFDVKIKAQRKNPFSRMEENERAKELYAMGFFNPERATESLLALEMMDFEGIDKIREKVAEGQTLLNLVEQMSAQLTQLTSIMGLGAPIPNMAEDSASDIQTDVPKGNTPTDKIMQSQAPQTPYTQKLVARSKPSVGE